MPHLNNVSGGVVHKQENKEEQKVIEAEKETSGNKYSSFVKFVFIPVVVVGILYVGFREMDRLKRIVKKD
jgi:hypothetical protein